MTKKIIMLLLVASLLVNNFIFSHAEEKNRYVIFPLIRRL